MKTAFEEFAQQKQQAQQVKPALQRHNVEQAKEAMRAKLAQKAAQRGAEYDQKNIGFPWKKVAKILWKGLMQFKNVMFFFKALLYLLVMVILYNTSFSIDWSKVHQEVEENVRKDKQTEVIILSR